MLLVWPCKEKMEERNDCSFELRPSARVDRCWRKCLPDDRFADIRGNKQRDSAAQAVSLLEQFVKEDDN